MNPYWLALLLILFLPGEPAPVVESRTTVPVGSKMKGVNFVAPRDPFDRDPMQEVQEVGIDWVAVIPFGFTRLGEPRMYHDQDREWHWWGEQPEGARETIRLAKARGLKVMLKPQVWIPGSWPGDLDFATEAEWEQWEKDYREYILLYAGMAAGLGVELFCVGTEFKISGVRREAFWRELIRAVRQVYPGKLTYAANWDEYPTLPFWDELDYIGIDAYFPLSDRPTPTVDHLVRCWAPIKGEIRRFSNKVGKPVLFTEYGYLSVDGCAGKTWILEKDRRPLRVNEQSQANALEALYQTFWNEPFWHGGFIWKWYPKLPSRPGRREKDYTPQGKLAQQVMEHWFRR